MKFKIGDQVKLIKLSKEDFKQVYNNLASVIYINYLKVNKNRFNKISTITKIDKSLSYPYWISEFSCFCYEKELELAITLKDKLEILKDLK